MFVCDKLLIRLLRNIKLILFKNISSGLVLKKLYRIKNKNLQAQNDITPFKIKHADE